MKEWYMNSNFVIDTSGLSDQAIEYGHGRATIKVRGYWSNESITLYVRRYYADWQNGEKSVDWKVEISHASGGRDDAVCNDTEAARCFGEALIAAADFAEQLKDKFKHFESVFQERKRVDRAEREADEARKQAEFDMDSPLGMETARSYLDRLISAEVPEYNRHNVPAHIVVVPRGPQKQGEWLVVHHGKKTRFFINSMPVSKQSALETLAASSHRSHYTHPTKQVEELV